MNAFDTRELSSYRCMDAYLGGKFIVLYAGPKGTMLLSHDG
jgi:hypothetical protein